MAFVSARESADSPVRAATTLALWGAARVGGLPGDETLRGIDGSGYRAGVRAADGEVATRTGLPGPGERSAPAAALLALFTRGGTPELLLPSAGDLRGLPPGGAVVVPALDAGAMVVLPDIEIGLVPRDGQWRAYPCTGRVMPLTLSEAQYLIDTAMQAATRDLVNADVARGADTVRERVREVMLAEAVDTPPDMPRRASALLAKVISLQALLEVAEKHETARRDERRTRHGGRCAAPAGPGGPGRSPGRGCRRSG